MTEPAEIAPVLEPVVDGIWHWRISNAAIGGGISSSHAIRVVDDSGAAGCVVVDPVRLDPHAEQQLPKPIVAVVLTSHGHQRAAWRMRREHGAEIWAPSGSEALEESPDREYGDGDELPGGLVAVHTPGPEQAHYSLHLPRHNAVIVSDLVRRPEEGDLEFVPPQYHEDAGATRESTRRLAELGCAIVLLDHGAPITSGGSDQLRRLASS